MSDYSKLRGRIKEKIGNESKLGELLGITQGGISGKLNNKVSFSPEEIRKIIDILEIPHDEVYDYFFYNKSSEK